MASQQTWQDRIDALAHGEVQPLLVATDVERRERLTVHVVLIDPADDVRPSGHRSHGPVLSRSFDVPLALTTDQVGLMRQETIAHSSRLRTLLSDPAG